MTTICDKCKSLNVTWAGFSRRALRRTHPVKDVQQCAGCNAAWYYASTGKRMYVKQYVVVVE